MTHPNLRLSAGLLLALGLTSCGSVSSLQTPSGSRSTPVAGNYDHLVVRPLRDASNPDSFATWTPEEQREYRQSVKQCGESIASQVITEVSGHSKFKSVGSKPVKGRTLLVDGEITNFNNGVASLRLFVGMGAGSSHLEGTAFVRDASTGKEVGRIVIDKASWPLGGVIAMSQNADKFGQGAAEKIAEEVTKFAP